MKREVSKQSLLNAELSVSDQNVICMATGKQPENTIEAARTQAKGAPLLVHMIPNNLEPNSIAHLHKHTQSLRT